MQKVTRKDLRFLAVVLASLVLACSGMEASRKTRIRLGIGLPDGHQLSFRSGVFLLGSE